MRPDCETMTIDEVTQVLQVSKPTARKILGDPDDITVTVKGLPKYHYMICRVEKAKNELDEIKNCKPEKGLRKCRSCPAICRKDELVSGRCASCRAFWLVKNFCCHGDCFKCKEPDCKLIKQMENAVQKLKNQNSVS